MNHTKGNELPDMTGEQCVALRRNLMRVATEKTSPLEGVEVVFIGTLEDLNLKQPNYPYSLWRVFGLSDSLAIKEVQEVIEKVVCAKPDKSYMTIVSKCII